jgi:hypothetical protein
MGATASAVILGVANLSGPLQWDVRDLPAPASVVVLPPISVAAAPRYTDDTWVGAGLTPHASALRHRRLADVGRTPNAVADALPGALARELGDAAPEFHPGEWPAGTRRAVEDAVLHPRELPAALSDVGRRAGAPVLVTWVRRVDAVPLTALSHPGDILAFEFGPVVVDGTSEPYRVDLTVGAALIGADGVVGVRLEDTWTTVVDAAGPHDAARQAADGIAEDLRYFWPVD